MAYVCEECGTAFNKPSLLLKHRRTENHWKSYKCDICEKGFTRKDNRDRHRARHEDDTQHHCECGMVFSRSDNYFRHKQEKHQVGGGKRRPTEDGQDPAPKRIKITDDPKSFYTLEKIREKDMPKFNTKSSTYSVKFKDISVDGLPEILKALKRIFTSIIEDITKFSKATDLIRFTVQCPELDFPISIPFMRKDQINVERFLSEIERVLQSYEQFVLDNSLEIDITHVNMPEGGYQKKCHYVDLERFLKEKKCILHIENKDNLCCARAIVTGKARLDRHPQWNSIRQGRSVQKQFAMRLHEQADVPLGKCGIEEIKKFQAVTQGYQIYIVSKAHFNGITFSGPESEKKIYLYHHDDHFDVITSMPAFLNKNYYCHQCQKGFDHKEKHKCYNICSSCRKIHEASKDEVWTLCIDCNRYFRGLECLSLHKKITEKGNSTCNTFFRCKDCGQTVNRKMHKKDHQCHEVYCNTCKDYFGSEHLCYMIPVGERVDNESPNIEDTEDKYVFADAMQQENDQQTYIFFDFECTQDDMIECERKYEPDSNTGICKNCGKKQCGTSFEHVPNLCVAHKVCTRCMNRNVTLNSKCQQCGNNEMIFHGTNTTADFCKWLFSESNTGATVLCHNFKAYDSYPILRYLYQNGILPKVIPNGAKNMSIEVPSCKIRMIDSINFLAASLGKLPQMFGLDELAKGYFPHMFNRKENQHVKLHNLPDIRYYNPDAMKEEDHRQFVIWYEQNKANAFDFQHELLKYCRSDVDILRRCCLEFRRLFMEMTSSGPFDSGIDPFEQSITIASACNLVFRTKFLEAETIGIIPPQGYRPEEKQSVKALQWIKYLSHVQQIPIQHARNGGEKQIGPYKADGYYETETGEKVVLEMQGCFWHGHSQCFSRDTINPVNKMTMGDLYQRTLDKKKYLESEGYTYIEKWECDFDKEVREDEKLRSFLDSIDIVTPLEPRNAFHGGRTEAFTLYKKSSDEEKIKYYDVTSLYPYINKTGKAVLGHPRIITENFEDISNYEGLIKCKITPPRGLYMPVLPAKINGKLHFALCKTCTENKQQTSCTHTDEERSFVGTWVTDEIKKATEKGYNIQKIYEVWHFDRTEQYDPNTKSGGIFKEYIDTFVKMKQEASGWPSWCVTEVDKQQYIRDYFDKEGILLDHAKIRTNPGLRALAKLMLNSFWGKFGQRQNMAQVEYVADPARYFDILTSDEQEVTGVSFVTDDMVEMRWKYREDFVEASGRTNVVLAAYTTAQARLKLYSYLEKLGPRALYADTDSIVFSVKTGEWEPFLGDYLGDLTDQVEKKSILEFVTGGPKNYAYTVDKPIDGKYTCCKIRGITLNFKTKKLIDFQTVKDMVTGPADHKVTVVYSKIGRDPKNTKIITKCESKDYRIVFDKRVLRDNYISFPYGM